MTPTCSSTCCTIANDEAIAILRACRRVIAPGAALLAVERVVPGPNEGAEVKFADLNMLVGPRGQGRTRDEFVDLLAAAGFRLAQVTPAGALHVVEGVPV